MIQVNIWEHFGSLLLKQCLANCIENATIVILFMLLHVAHLLTLIARRKCETVPFIPMKFSNAVLAMPFKKGAVPPYFVNVPLYCL